MRNRRVQLPDDLLTQREQRRRVGDVKRGELDPQLATRPVPELDRRQRVQPVRGQGFGRLEALVQAQHFGELLVDNVHGRGEQNRWVRAGAVQQSERLDVLGAIGAGFPRRCSREVADEQGAEAGISLQRGVVRLGDGDAGDQLGGAGLVDGRKLLEDGVAEDLVQRGLVDPFPLSGVEMALHAALFCDVTHVFNEAQVRGVCWQAQRVAIPGESVQESIGCRVVGLTFLPHHAGNARKHGEETKWLFLLQGCAMEIPGPLHLARNRGVVLFHRHDLVRFVLDGLVKTAKVVDK